VLTYPGPAGNPLNTTQSEPGSTNWNSADVKVFANADSETCWYWGIKANAGTLVNGSASYHYGAIISVLQNPASSNDAQCDALAVAVGNSSWGTGNFSRYCGESFSSIAEQSASLRALLTKPHPASGPGSRLGGPADRELDQATGASSSAAPSPGVSAVERIARHG
jgi:hypothetical protein